MFDNMKKMWEMKKKMEEVKRGLDAMSLEKEDNNVKIVVSGSQEVKSIEIKCDLAGADKYQIECSIKDVMNKVLKDSQKAAAGQMQAMGGLADLLK